MTINIIITMFVPPLCKIYVPPVCKIVCPRLHVENACLPYCMENLCPQSTNKSVTDRQTDIAIYISYIQMIFMIDMI